jgi:AcrR family transcriptional regulator
MAITEPTPRGPGRPRNEASDRQIIAATLSMLAREGYDRTSIEGVAAEAGVTRATVYRRYATKAEMVTAAVCTLAEAEEPAGCPDVRTTLVELLRGFRSCVEPNDGLSIVASLYLQRHEHPEMLDSFRERVIRPTRLRMEAVLELARERGDVRADTDPEEVVGMLMGSYLYRTLAGLPIPQDWPAQVVAGAWHGLAPSGKR